MKCRYCKQKLNLFKSLSGSSFCSPEHQKLYEEAEASKGFERLLQFVEKDGKPAPAAAKPTPPAPSKPQAKLEASPEAKPAFPVPPQEPRTIPARVETVADPPLAGFLFDRKGVPSGASLVVNANFEIPGADFPVEPPALPSAKFQIIAAQLPTAELPTEALPTAELPTVELPTAELSTEVPPPPLASWSNPTLSEIDSAKTSAEVQSVSAVRPRAGGLEMPPPESYQTALGAPPILFSSYDRGLQPSIQAVLDTRAFANLARLNPLQREVRVINEKAQASSVEFDENVPSQAQPLAAHPMAISGDTPAFANLPSLNPLPREVRAIHEKAQAAPAEFAVLALSRVDSAAVLNVPPQAKALGERAIPMSGAMTRAGIGGKVSRLPAGTLHSQGTLCISILPGQIRGGIQDDAPRPGQPETAPALVEQSDRRVPAMHWSIGQTGAPCLSGSAFVDVKRALGDKPVAIATYSAMTRAGAARTIRQPQARSSRYVNALGSNQTLNPVSTHLRDTAHPPACAMDSERLAQPACAAPAVASKIPEAVKGLASVIAAKKLIIRESDRTVSRGITDVTKAPAIASPLVIPDAPAARRSVTLGADPLARPVLAQIQAEDRSFGCALAVARQTLRDALLPTTIWSSQTWLKSAIAFADGLSEIDSATPAIPSGAPATRLFPIRFAPALFVLDLPAITRDRNANRFILEVCEWKSEAQRLAHSQPSRTSPLSLVVLPWPSPTPLVVRHVARRNKFTLIATPAASGILPSTAAAGSADEHKPTLALPHSTGLGLSFVFKLTSQSALAPLPGQPIERKNPEIGSRPQPLPVRAQPASMLVLPVSCVLVRNVGWITKATWATVACDSLLKRDLPTVTSHEPNSPASLRSLADAVRVDREESVNLRLNPRRPVISLDLGVQTSPHEVLAANALPRRRGPKLPIVTVRQGGLIGAGR